MRDCPTCGADLESTGLAYDEVYEQLVDTFRCRCCGEDFASEPERPIGWREAIRERVRAYRRGAA